MRSGNYLGFAIGGFVFCVFFLIKAAIICLKSKRYEKTVAAVTHIEMVEQGKTTLKKVSYEFTSCDGIKQCGSSKCYKNADFEIGSEIDVFYDPKRPEKSFAREEVRGSSAAAWIFACGAVFFLIVGIISLNSSTTFFDQYDGHYYKYMQVTTPDRIEFSIKNAFLRNGSASVEETERKTIKVNEREVTYFCVYGTRITTKVTGSKAHDVSQKFVQCYAWTEESGSEYLAVVTFTNINDPEAVGVEAVLSEVITDEAIRETGSTK